LTGANRFTVISGFMEINPRLIDVLVIYPASEIFTGKENRLDFIVQELQRHFSEN
jgi:hypothetical protein